ncbi:MAG: hypothetical protein JRG80_02985 [Deltaproteobacteria bacterium]|nr:hypothetical protein [Deltaproteobacteria bacterium]MBW2398219.1 hypothetical protein [Deltaproteobacteria bacterium]MBW2667597.1 hypothetical protein [Deltaproteobacteria bacterium]
MKAAIERGAGAEPEGFPAGGCCAVRLRHPVLGAGGPFSPLTLVAAAITGEA